MSIYVRKYFVLENSPVFLCSTISKKRNFGDSKEKVVKPTSVCVGGLRRDYDYEPLDITTTAIMNE